MRPEIRRNLLICLIIAVIVITVIIISRDDTKLNQIPDRKLQKVVFGVLPYLDHTYAEVGKKMGWFEEAGIDLEIKEVGVEHIIPWLNNNTINVCSTPPGILMAAWDNAPNLRSFVFGNLFTGYAIMAQPDAGYRTYRQFKADGFSPNEAAKRTISQIRGKRFAYPPEDAIRPFIDLTLSKAGLHLEQMQTVVIDDPLTVNAMRKNTVDFQTGGAPSRVTLQGEGFISIFDSTDLLDFAKPSADSPELAGVLQNGWATTKSFYDANHELVLRLACVNFRIMEALQKEDGDARKIHLNYLASLTGVKNYTSKQSQSLYNDLNKFRTFDQQADWFENKKSKEYYAYINGSILNSWTRRPGYFQKRPPRLEDVIFADRIYHEIKMIRKEAESWKAAITSAQEKGQIHPTPAQLDEIQKAIDKYNTWNVLDAKQLFENVGKEMGIKIERI